MRAWIHPNILKFTQVNRFSRVEYIHTISLFGYFLLVKNICNSCNWYIFLISVATAAATAATCYNQCSVCSRSFTNERYLVRHRCSKDESNSDFQCHECGKRYTFERNLKGQKESTHERQKNIGVHLVRENFIHSANIRLICWHIVERSHITSTDVA